MPKNKTGKKISVVRDELNIKGAGLYCFLPYNRLDNHKAVFKIGMTTTSFTNRLESYHTYFPNGVYMVAFLENPLIPKTLRSNQKGTPKTQHYLAIEKYTINYLVNHGSKRIYSSTRIKNKNAYGEGETEWIYGNVETIHKAFQEAEKKYFGNLYLYYLEGLDPNTGKFTSINQEADESESKKQIYTGKIIFHI